MANNVLPADLQGKYEIVGEWPAKFQLVGDGTGKCQFCGKDIEWKTMTVAFADKLIAQGFTGLKKIEAPAPAVTKPKDDKKSEATEPS